ncbi:MULTISPECIES: aKG-HExxH-type peptide beta-hydroxylase [Streptomyces]|uniref:aKG-HExxH-type peptide beta-hydroxylase n=1 Tax=Streptomyces TaxID=1883 RepID=UPI0004CCEC75|nr:MULTISPECIES: HEXXH motif-containing putative peptide modification protein [Streptomyces]KOT64390.1 hypothetical protein ADK43_06095 [Streptomyces rimosus subsp. rimosus]
MERLLSARPFVPAQLGGWPFLDDGHIPRRLLTAVACVRLARRDGPSPAPAPQELAAVLAPDEALRIRALDLSQPPPCGDLAPARHDAIGEALHQIAERVPAWAVLLTALPVAYLPLPADRTGISASCFAWPQHVLLSERAFAHPAVLAEQILHELCHQWLYLCQELIPLQRPGPLPRITLPSGTGGRSPAELLGAAHVTCALTRLWPWLEVAAPLRDERLAQLRTYLRGCRSLLSAARPHLNEHGHALADRIQEMPA